MASAMGVDAGPTQDVGGQEAECAICLEPVKDRCVLPVCFHSCLYVFLLT